MSNTNYFEQINIYTFQIINYNYKNNIKIFVKIGENMYICNDRIRHASHRTANQGGSVIFIVL